MATRDRFMDRRPSHGMPAPTKTPAPGGRPSFGTPTPTPYPTMTPAGRPSIDDTMGYDGSKPFNINLDEFLQNPDAVEEKTRKREEFMRGGSPQGALGGKPTEVASAKMGPTPEDEDKFIEMMREYGPTMDDTLPRRERRPKFQERISPPESKLQEWVTSEGEIKSNLQEWESPAEATKSKLPEWTSPAEATKSKLPEWTSPAEATKSKLPEWTSPTEATKAKIREGASTTPEKVAPSARMKLQQKMYPTPEPAPTPNIHPKWHQLGTPAPARPTYDEELVQELLGKRRG